MSWSGSQCRQCRLQCSWSADCGMLQPAISLQAAVLRQGAWCQLCIAAEAGSCKGGRCQLQCHGP